MGDSTNIAEEHTIRKSAGTIILGWLIFIGIDFLFHASLLHTYWDDDLPALLDQMTLFQRIPFGYASFLLLTGLAFYLMTRIHGPYPRPKEAMHFGFIFGGFFSLSNFLGLYSYIDLPALHLLLFSGVYFIELVVVSVHMAYMHRGLSKKKVFATITAFFVMIVLGIGFQNLA